MSFEIVQLPN